VPKGILSRSEKITSMPLSVSEGTKIQVLVENQGRINYGSLINDFKVSLQLHVRNDTLLE
jgi:beta-galactosidase